MLKSENILRVALRTLIINSICHTMMIWQNHIKPSNALPSLKFSWTACNKSANKCLKTKLLKSVILSTSESLVVTIFEHFRCLKPTVLFLGKYEIKESHENNKKYPLVVYVYLADQVVKHLLSPGKSENTSK